MKARFLVLATALLLTSCRDDGSDSSSALQWEERNHAENNHHMFLGIDHPGMGKTAEAIRANSPESVLSVIAKDAVTDSQFTVYNAQTIDTRAYRSGVSFPGAGNPIESCLKECINDKGCGLVTLSLELVTNVLVSETFPDLQHQSTKRIDFPNISSVTFPFTVDPAPRSVWRDSLLLLVQL